MDNYTFYKVNNESLEFEKLSERKTFWLNNTWLKGYIYAIIVICVLFGGVLLEERRIVQVAQLECQISELNTMLEIEEEADVLHVKIAQATLEGKKNIPFNDSIVLEYIKSCKAWYPEIIMAQYKIESASGKSDVAKKANNFFGMKPVSGKRKHYTTQRHGDTYCGYAVYDNWKLSILDKILWEHFRFNEVKPDKETYLKAHLNYAEADEYIKTIKQVAKQYANGK